MAKLFGFVRQDAVQLKKVARREGLKPDNTASGRYPSLLESGARLALLTTELSPGNNATAREIILTVEGENYGEEFEVRDGLMNSDEGPIPVNTRIVAIPCGELWLVLPYCKVTDRFPPPTT